MSDRRSAGLLVLLTLASTLPAPATAVGFKTRDGGDSGTSLLVSERFVGHFHIFDDAKAFPNAEAPRPCWTYDSEAGFAQPRPCYLELVNRLEAQLNVGRTWQVGAQLSFAGSTAHRDSQVAFYGPGWPPDERPIEGERFGALVVPEKLRLRYRTRKLRLELGDFYTTFGNGTALNLIKNVPVDQDTTLRGLRVDLEPVEWFGGTAVMGFTNPQRISFTFPNRGLARRVMDLVYGLELHFAPKWWLNLSTHGVVLGMASPSDDWHDRGPFPLPDVRLFASPTAYIVGGNATATSLVDGALDVAFEGNAILYADEDRFGRRREDGTDASPWGYDLYGMVNAYIGRLTLTGEVHRNFHAGQHNQLENAGVRDFQFGAPPTLEVEEVIVEKSSFAVASNDITGGRLQAHLGLDHEWLLNAALSVFGDDEIHRPFTYFPETILHPSAGFEKGWEDGSHVVFMTGSRFDLGREVDTTDERAPEGPAQLYHVNAIAVIGLPHAITLDLAATARHWRGEVAGHQEEWTAMESAVGASFLQGKIAALVFVDYTSEPQPQSPQFGGSVGNIFYNGDALDPESVFLAGEVIVKPWERAKIRAFYGSSKAGLRCAGGQCRNLPGRSGFRMEFEGAW
jgi:hypothetical protein